MCNSCIKNLKKLNTSIEIKSLQPLFNWDWLGDEGKAGTPANIVSKLGGKLFVTSGLDKLNQLLKEEGIKSSIEIVKALILAVLAFLLATQHIKLC